MFVLAHLSDPHLGPLPDANAFDLAGKRALGFINWHRNRKDIHRVDVLDQIVHDLKSQTADHIAVTGDLVNLALPEEFPAGRRWLDRLGPPDAVTFVPGNHDLYVRTAMHETRNHWGAYMEGDARESFPFVRRRGPVALIGLSSAIPTAPFMATGALGKAQIESLAQILQRLAKEDVFRVVLIHHPPSRSHRDRFKRLIDTRGLQDVLRLHGAELVLHGHDHVHSVVFLEGASGRIPSVGVPSASASGGEGDPAAYHLFRIEGSNGSWRCEAVTRGFRRGQDCVGEITRRMLIGN